jgi:integrase
LTELYLIPELGQVELLKLAKPTIATFYAGLAQGGRHDGKPGGLSPRTRRHSHRILTGAMQRALEDDLIARNPTAAFRRRLPKVERPEMAILTAEQSTRLLQAIVHSTVYGPTLLALGLGLGLRRGEVLAVRWRNVDFVRGTLSVTGSLEQVGHVLRFKPTKSGRPRSVTMPQSVSDELRRRKRAQAETLLALGVRQSGDTLVCCRQDGAPLQPQSPTRGFQRLRDRLTDLPNVRFDDLRHSHAIQLLEAGVHIKSVQERLGHATAAFTLDRYGQATKTMQQEAAELIDAAFRRVGKSET